MNYSETIEKLRSMLQTDQVMSESIYLVGGCVRDLILGLEPKDIDLCIDIPDGIEVFSKWLKENFEYCVSGFCEFPRYGTMKFLLHLDSGEISEIECVIPRVETYNTGPRKPDQIKQTTIGEDALRRDFCCNALYKRVVDDVILDPTGRGLSDCRDKILRTPLEPKKTYIDDPLRMLRAIRFYCTKNFEIEEETKSCIYPYSNSYEKLSKERIRDEFEKILMSSKAIEGIELLHDHGLLKNIIPELVEAWNFDQCSKYHSLNLRDHLFSVLRLVMESGEDCLELRWSALLHDISKYKHFSWDGTYKHFKLHEIYSSYAAEKILIRLKYSNEFISNVSILVRNHMRFKQQYDYKDKKYTGTKKNLRKFISQLGSLVFKELELIEADNMSHAPKYNMPGQIDDIKIKISEIMSELSSNKISGMKEIGAVINGDDIMETLLIGPGITVREVKIILQDYLDENPDLSKEDLINKYMEEFGGKLFEVIPDEFNDITLKAVLGNTSFDFVATKYFKKDEIPRDKTKLPALYYPQIYRKLIRDARVKELVDQAGKAIAEIERLDGFRSIDLNLENHDLIADITWEDGSITSIL